MADLRDDYRESSVAGATAVLLGDGAPLAVEESGGPGQIERVKVGEKAAALDGDTSAAFHSYGHDRTTVRYCQW